MEELEGKVNSEDAEEYDIVSVSETCFHESSRLRTWCDLKDTRCIGVTGKGGSEKVWQY